MPSWGYIVFGTFLILFSNFLYRNRNSPNVYFEGCSPKLTTTVATIMGFVFIVVGIFGYFFPIVLKWMEVYFETAEYLLDIFDIIVFLLLQAFLIFGLFHTLVMKRGKSNWLPVVLFFTVLSAIYWMWIIGTEQFDNVYREPFENILKLLFE